MTTREETVSGLMDRFTNEQWEVFDSATVVISMNTLADFIVALEKVANGEVTMEAFRPVWHARLKNAESILEKKCCEILA